MSEKEPPIPAWSAADVEALLTIFALAQLLLLAVVLWLIPQFGLPHWIVLAFAAFFCMAAIHHLKVLWPKRALIPLGLRRAVGGKATVGVDPSGAHFSRRFWTKRRSWEDIETVRLDIDEKPGEPDEYHIVIAFKGGYDAWVQDDASWSRFEQINTWSGGLVKTRRI